MCWKGSALGDLTLKVLREEVLLGWMSHGKNYLLGARHKHCLHGVFPVPSRTVFRPIKHFATLRGVGNMSPDCKQKDYLQLLITRKRP